jgi:hypothetical protein
LSSITPDDDQPKTVGDNSQVTVSQYVDLDTYLGMPVEEIVWPTLASAWDASGATIPLSQVTEEVPAQHQERGNNDTKATQINLESSYDIELSGQPTQQHEILLPSAEMDPIPSPLEGDSDGAESSSDYEMDIDEEEIDQTTPSSGDTDLMEVDEEVIPLISSLQYPKLEAEWQTGIPQHVRADFLQQVSLGWQRLLGEMYRY